MNFKSSKRLLLATAITLGTMMGSFTQIHAATIAWTQVGAGSFSWNDTANWAPSTVPNAVAEVANFTTAGGPATQSVTLDIPVTIGALGLTNSATSYTISNGSGGPLAFDNGASAATITMGAGSLAQTLNADMTFGANGLVITNNTANPLTIGGQLTGGTNIYLTNTTASAGKIVLAGNDRLPTTASLNLFPANFPTSGVGSIFSTSLDLGANSQTLSTIKLAGASNPAAGAALAATGGLLTITGAGGTLTLNGDDFVVGISNSVTSYVGPNTHTVNMNSLSNFAFNNTAKSIVVHDSGTRVGSTTFIVGNLALGNNTTVNAKSILVADTGPSGVAGGGRSNLQLGTASNVLNIGSNATDGVINVGYSGRSTGTMNLPSGATLSIRGFGGGSAPLPQFLVGYGSNSNSGNVFTSTVDFNAGISNAIITQLDLGTAENTGGRGGGTVGVLNLGATSGSEGFTVGTLNLGIIKGTGPDLAQNFAATGTLTLNNANGVLNATTINFATNTIGSTIGAQTKTVTANLNLTNGTIRATTIQLGDQTGGTATVVKNFNWTTGTIENTSSANLSISGVPITLLTTASHTFNATGTNSINIASSSPISGATFGITKIGTGKLIFNATNTYTGLTTVSQGTLWQNGNHTGGGAYSVANNATLGGTGTITGAVTVDAGGNLAPGNSPGTLTVSSLSMSGSYDWELGAILIDSPTGTPGTNWDLLNVNGNLAINSGSSFDADFTILSAGNLPNSGNSFWETPHAWLAIDVTGGATTGNFTSVTSTHPGAYPGAYFTTVVGDGVSDINALIPGSGLTIVPGANDVYLVYVPEPSTFILSGLGLVGLALLGKRRAK